MFTRIGIRLLHTSRPIYSSEKSLLATLRKKTGYTFANCKKALDMHNNDIIKAEAWLKEQAQAMGWSKLTKLEGRKTSQGLVGVTVDGNNGAIIEVNCETDFVARNENFQEFVTNAAKACLKYSESIAGNSGLSKVNLNPEQLKELRSLEGKSLADTLALVIGNVGENASLRRATCFKTANDINLTGYAHPSIVNNGVFLGKFGAVVAAKSPNNNVSEVGKNICQHIVGLNPKKIGGDSDKPAENVEDEECLIYQEYINDDSFLVKEYLEENKVEIVDFSRFACGENIEEQERQEELKEARAG